MTPRGTWTSTPSRQLGLVAGDERVLDRDQRAELLLEQLGVGLDRLGQRQTTVAPSAPLDLGRRRGAGS